MGEFKPFAHCYFLNVKAFTKNKKPTEASKMSLHGKLETWK